MLLAVVMGQLVDARGDGPSPPLPGVGAVIEETKLHELATSIVRADITTVERTKRLQALFDTKPMVKRQGTISDVTSTGMSVVLKLTYSGREGSSLSSQIEVATADLDFAATWKRGDRVAWLDRLIGVDQQWNPPRLEFAPATHGLRGLTWNDIPFPPVVESDASYFVEEATLRAAFDAIDRADVTTLQRAKVRQVWIAATPLVRREGRIKDIVEDHSVPDQSVLTLKVIYPNIIRDRDATEFRIASTERSLVESWGRWDHIRWIERFTGVGDRRSDFSASGYDMNALCYERVFKGVGDLVWSKNPGFEPKPLAKPVGDLAAFLKMHQRRFSSQVEEHAEWVKRTWVIPCTVVGGDATEYFVRALALDDPKLDQKLLNQTILAPRFEGGMETELDSTDPQLAASIEKGSRVDVTIDYELTDPKRPDSFLESPRVRVWRLTIDKSAAPPKPPSAK
jgi:hypothetical protein